MKKIFVLLLMISAASFSFANPPVNEKVLKVFHDVFPAIENAKWYENENYYEVYFDNNDVKCRIRYDLNGKVLSTTRYYLEKSMVPFLRAKVAQKYPGKKVFGITEINSEEQLIYEVVLEDSKHWYTVQSDAIGQMSVTQKLQKADN